MSTEEKQQLYEYLAHHMSDGRKAQFERVVANRTRYLTVVLEDLFQSHNISAVMRTADCFGVQDVHIIEGRNKYEVNVDIALGASKWLTTHRHIDTKNNTVACYEALRKQGYKIVATSPHAKGYTIHDLPLDTKTALIFGTEERGLTPYAMDNADEYVAIPIHGFTESFNISVSAALFMQNFTDKIRNSSTPWQLTEDERITILLEWARTSVKASELLEKHYAMPK